MAVVADDEGSDALSGDDSRLACDWPRIGRLVIARTPDKKKSEYPKRIGVHITEQVYTRRGIVGSVEV